MDQKAGGLMRGYARRRDANEKGIVDALKAAGAFVERLSGDGVPDLLVGFMGVTLLMEVKLPLGPRGGKSQRREAEGGSGDFTKEQVKWWAEWTGARPLVVRSPEEAVRALESVSLRLADAGCHPGKRCSRWPECESCGPARL